MIKDYDLVIDYHSGKANVVADTLSQKSFVTLAHIHTTYVPLFLDMETLGISLDYNGYGALLASFVVRPTLVDQIWGKQMQDKKLVKEVNKIMNGEIGENFSISQNGVITMKSRVCVSNVEDLRKLIMEEAHCSAYITHPGSTKIYQIIKENYCWSSMKKDIANFVSRCLVCQQIKAKHQKPLGTLHPSPFTLHLFQNGSGNTSP